MLRDVIKKNAALNVWCGILRPEGRLKPRGSSTHVYTHAHARAWHVDAHVRTRVRTHAGAHVFACVYTTLG